MDALLHPQDAATSDLNGTACAAHAPLAFTWFSHHDIDKAAPLSLPQPLPPPVTLHPRAASDGAAPLVHSQGPTGISAVNATCGSISVSAGSRTSTDYDFGYTTTSFGGVTGRSTSTSTSTSTGSGSGSNRSSSSSTGGGRNSNGGGRASTTGGRNRRRTACSTPAAGRPSASCSPSSTSSRSVSPRSRPKKKTSMPGRPPKKRPADGGDGGDYADDSPVNGGGGGGKVKHPKMDRGAVEDFSSVVKNRLQQYTRTGQACDRCKVRKIRCDALPEGCSHCISLSLDCYVTDRVTGRTERRGYMQELEREKNGMLQHIRDLEKLLGNQGTRVKPWQGAAWAHYHPDATVDDLGNATQTASSSDDWSKVDSLWVKSASERQAPTTYKAPRTQLRLRPTANSGRAPSRQTAPLSSIGGTQLSILGTTIDLASFDAPDVDEPPEDADMSAPLYNKSVKAFLQSATGKNPPVQADLPSREDAFMYIEWYFMTISAFLPLLHKPSFMRLLTRIYDERNFVPSVPEMVTVHMILAIIYFHCGIRNWHEAERQRHLNDLSNKHYHFALSKMFELLNSRDLSAIQALALIASHARAFPKPGCGSVVANMALQRAIDLGLHRISSTPRSGTDLQNELRKRAWWVIITVIIAVNGRRGLPLPITANDFEVDFPEPIADELLTDDGVDMSRTLPCTYEAGIAAFKIALLFMQVFAYNSSFRKDMENHVEMVYALERQIDQWEAELPPSLRLNGYENQNLAALFVKTFSLELRFWLRHPSFAVATDKKFMADSTRICEETAREFLHCVQEIYKMKSLDTTWYQMSVYVGCIFSMLVSHWERRFTTSPDKVAHLREEMSSWMAILKETSLLLGSGDAIITEIGGIIERTIGWIEHDMQNRDAKKQSISAPIKQDHHPPQPAYQHSQTSTVPVAAAGNSSNAVDGAPKGYYHDAHVNTQTPYPNLAYRDQPQSTTAQPPYQAGATIFYTTSAQVTAEAAAAAAAAVVATAPVPDGSSQPNPMPAFSQQATHHVSGHASTDMLWNPRGNTWHDWAAAISDTQDRYSANALLTLGNGGRASVASSGLGDGVGGPAVADLGVVTHGGQWPLIMFDHGATSGT